MYSFNGLKQYDNEIIQRYNNGECCKKISISLGASEQGICYRLKINNIKKRTVSESLIGRTLSESHKKEISRVIIDGGLVKGSRNPSWKGGVQDKWSELKNSHEYKIWRKAVYERDNYICRGCGYGKGGILEAHHILTRAKFPHLIFNIDNGVTLCTTCHRFLHSKRVNFHWRELLETPTVKSGTISSRAEKSEGSTTMHSTRKG